MKRKMVITLLLLLVYFSTGYSFGSNVAVDFNALFDQHGSIMLLIDSETGSILYANDAACAFYGYSEEHMLSRNIDDMNVLSAEEVSVEMKNALSESRNYFRFKHLAAHGAIKDVEVYSYPFAQDGEVKLFSIIHDVTERAVLEQNNTRMSAALIILLLLIIAVLLIYHLILKHKNQALLDVNGQIENFNALRTEFINADNRLIYLKNEDLQYVFVNSAMEKFYGKPASEFVGKSDYAISPSQFAEVKTSHDHDVLIHNKEIHREVHWNNRIYKAIKFPIKMLNGTTGVGAYIEDITEQQKTQKELERNLRRNKLLVDALSQVFTTHEDIYRTMLMHAMALTTSDAGLLYVKNQNSNAVMAFEFEVSQLSIAQSTLSIEALDCKLKSLEKHLVSHIPTNPGCFIIVALTKEVYDYELRDIDHINILIKSMQSIVDKSLKSS